MTIADVYFDAVDLALDQEGSGTGISYWSALATCARSYRLSQDQGALEANRLPFPRDTVKGKPKLIATNVGTAYHVLQELDPADLGPIEQSLDRRRTPEVDEALRLFQAYRASWGNTAAKWQMVNYRKELHLPTRPYEQRVTDCLGALVTGRPDGMGYIPHTSWLEETFQLKLTGPGYYLVDHKTDAAEKDENEWKYQISLQAIHYLWLAMICFPQLDIRGLITDVVYKTARVKFGAFFTPIALVDPKRVEHLVSLGRQAKARDLCNPVGCTTWFGVCPHLKAGRCRGY